MPRQRRIVVPGVPHHITARGNRKQIVFHENNDYALYYSFLRIYSTKVNVKVLAWCLMPNHIHIVLVPNHEDDLRALFSPLHTAFAGEINRKYQLSGHLWQDRYASIALDEEHTIAALRYVELNPVRASLTRFPWDFPFSSARGHLGIVNDPLLSDHEFVTGIEDWRGFLLSGIDDELIQQFRHHELNGYPLGNRQFLDDCELTFGRTMRPKRRGPKPVKGVSLESFQ